MAGTGVFKSADDTVCVGTSVISGGDAVLEMAVIAGAAVGCKAGVVLVQEVSNANVIKLIPNSKVPGIDFFILIICKKVLFSSIQRREQALTRKKDARTSVKFRKAKRPDKQPGM